MNVSNSLFAFCQIQMDHVVFFHVMHELLGENNSNHNQIKNTDFHLAVLV